MRPILTFLFLLFNSFTVIYAQTQSPSSRIREKYFFIYLDGKEVKYFLTKPESGEPIKNTIFPLTGTYSNIYMKWLNPLRYTVAFNDTVAVDPRDQAIKDFVAAMQLQHGSAATTGVSKSGTPGDGGDHAGEKDIHKQTIKTPITIRSFRNAGLVQLYTILRINQQKFTDSVRAEINRIGAVLDELDVENSAIDMSANMNTYFGQLYAIDDPSKVTQKTKDIRDKLEIADKSYKKNENLQNTIERELEKLDLKDEAETERFKATVNDFLAQAKKNVTANKAAQAKIPPVLDIMDKSVKNPSKDQPEYFPVKSISFDEGKTLKSTLSVTEKEYKSDSKSFIDKEQLVKTNLKFERYDPFGISVSTGIFYGSTTLKGFGVSNENNEFTVTEDDIEKGNFVTAAFLNFTFNAGSRYLLPFFQLGIDPTKKRPFLMAGGGFRIPSSKFALSAGPLWTWDQKLNKLTVGQKITSTTDLEKDIKYEFDPSPKGWYLGFQYNF